MPAPDLSQYLYLPGRLNGQTVVGVDATAPTVTITQTTIGAVIQRWMAAGLTAMDVSLEVNGSGNDIVFTGPRALAIRVGDNSSGLRLTTSGYTSISGIARNSGWWESGKVGGTDMNLMITGFNGDFIGSTAQWGYRRVYFGDYRTSDISATLVKSCVAFRIDPVDYVGATGLGGFHPTDATSGPYAGLIVGFDTAQAGLVLQPNASTGTMFNAFEVRSFYTGASPSRLLGDLYLSMTIDGHVRFHNQSATPSAYLGLQTDNSIACLSAVDVGTNNVMMLFRRETAWADSTSSTNLVMGDDNHPVIVGRNRSILARLGIASKYTLFSSGSANAASAEFPVPEAHPSVVRIRNADTSGDVASVILKIEAAGQFQSGNLQEWVNYLGTVLASVDATSRICRAVAGCPIR
jgi:hypothetical protein